MWVVSAVMLPLATLTFQRERIWRETRHWGIDGRLRSSRAKGIMSLAALPSRLTTQEESGLTVEPQHMTRRGRLIFTFAHPTQTRDVCDITLYTAERWTGDPQE